MPFTFLYYNVNKVNIGNLALVIIKIDLPNYQKVFLQNLMLMSKKATFPCTFSFNVNLSVHFKFIKKILHLYRNKL